jgi:hypothetical protein
LQKSPISIKGSRSPIKQPASSYKATPKNSLEREVHSLLTKIENKQSELRKKDTKRTSRSPMTNHSHSTISTHQDYHENNRRSGYHYNGGNPKATSYNEVLAENNRNLDCDQPYNTPNNNFRKLNANSHQTISNQNQRHLNGVPPQYGHCSPINNNKHVESNSNNYQKPYNNQGHQSQDPNVNFVSNYQYHLDLGSQHNPGHASMNHSYCQGQQSVPMRNRIPNPKKSSRSANPYAGRDSSTNCSRVDSQNKENLEISRLAFDNSRISGISCDYSVDMVEKGFLNFYKENKTNSSFINVNMNENFDPDCSLDNEFFEEDDGQYYQN